MTRKALTSNSLTGRLIVSRQRKRSEKKWNEKKESTYPVNDEKNNNIYLKYKELSDHEPKVIFAGRLGKYKYYDMKDIIEEVFKQFDM